MLMKNVGQKLEKLFEKYLINCYCLEKKIERDSTIHFFNLGKIRYLHV